MKSIYEWAKRYKEIGWSVFPVNNKIPAIKEVVPYRTKYATDAELKEWFDNKDVGIAVITGKLSGLIVIDDDSMKKSGVPSEFLSKINSSVKSRTGGGGMHYFLKYEEGFSNKVNIAEKFVDVRSEGGYVIIPPTKGSRQDYVWLSPPTKENLEKMPKLSATPEIAGKIKQQDYRMLNINDYLFVGEGQRDDALFRLSRSLLNRIPKEQVRDMILNIANNYKPPFLPRDAEKCFNQALRYYLQEKGKMVKMPKKIDEVAKTRIRERILVKKAPSTGSKELDELIEGFVPGNLYTITGDTNCLDQNTKIDYSVNGKKTHKTKVKNLFFRFNEGEQLSVNSLDIKTNKIVKNKVVNITYAGFRDCFALKCNNLTSIVATSDHQFYVGDGQFKKLKDLRVGDCVYIRSKHAKKTNIAKKAYYKEIMVKFHPNNKKKNEELHHKNHNPTDNTIRNLELVNRSHHARYHALHRAQSGDFLRYGEARIINSIEPVGKKHTYDIECASPLNNFVADGYIVHNSGKTIFCCNIAVNLAKQKRKVLYIALETGSKIVEVIASILHDKSYDLLTNEDIMIKNDYIDLFIDRDITTVIDLEKTIKQLEIHYDLVIIDHIGYFVQDRANYLQDQANIMKQLRYLTKEKNTAILLVAHLRKREKGAKKDYIPTADDISGSAAFKQDSTDVMIIIRKKDDFDLSGIKVIKEGYLYVVKTKGKSVGSINLLFHDTNPLNKKAFIQIGGGFL